MTASRVVTVVRPSPSSTRYACRKPQHTKNMLTSSQRAKTTKKVVLRLECTACKARFTLLDICNNHLTMRRPRHNSPSSVASTLSSVVTRRPRVPLLSSKHVPLFSLFCWALGVVFNGGWEWDGYPNRLIQYKQASMAEQRMVLGKG